MYIFIEEKTFIIQKVKKVDNGWKLIPVDAPNKVIFISHQCYLGKMPPFFRFPWQTFSLRIQVADDFIISAFINDKKLFQVEEKDYPPQILIGIQNGNKLREKIKKEEDEATKKLKIELENYLKVYENKLDIEKESSQFHVCWRAYLRLHLLKGPATPDYEKRITLMFDFVRIVTRLYNRRILEDGMEGIVQMALLELEYTISYRHSELMEHLDDNYQDDTDQEIEREFDKLNLPTPSLKLKRFFIKEIKRLIWVFSHDYPCLIIDAPRDWNNNIIGTPESNFLHLQKKMESIRFESIILPKKFTEAEIKDFLMHTSLRKID